MVLARKQSADDEAQRIVQLTAKIILKDIRTMKFDNSTYPSSEDITNLDNWNKWLPEPLKQFLSIIKSPVRQTVLVRVSYLYHVDGHLYHSA